MLMMMMRGVCVAKHSTPHFEIKNLSLFISKKELLKAVTNRERFMHYWLWRQTRLMEGGDQFKKK